QRKEYLSIAVEKLPEKYKKLVDLRYFQELSYEEVADELDLPLGTVKAQLFRARELLAQELKYLEGKM
ncbi:MAG: sigma-70 family RNA polymerase sigma factor, partial [Bacteroidia bacterium]